MLDLTAISLGICSLSLKWLACNVLVQHLMAQDKATKELILQCSKFMLNFKSQNHNNIANIHLRLKT
tara:strand:- start:6977 stop:7177 length:201 start_codon:yes stop_codon:yes gene_type:complete